MPHNSAASSSAAPALPILICTRAHFAGGRRVRQKPSLRHEPIRRACYFHWPIECSLGVCRPRKHQSSNRAVAKVGIGGKSKAKPKNGAKQRRLLFVSTISQSWSDQSIVLLDSNLLMRRFYWNATRTTPQLTRCDQQQKCSIPSRGYRFEDRSRRLVPTVWKVLSFSIILTVP